MSSRTFCAHVIIIKFLFLISCHLVYGTATDICLKSIKDSLEDPYGYLKSSWDFNSNAEGFICRFTGVECWHSDENRIFNLKLSNMGLKGQFPRAIQNCSTFIRLDLSINKLSGKIPADINILLPFVITLNLSSNEFSGTNALTLANCSYLNSLSLDRNRLSGQIPGLFRTLTRLKTLSVTNNLLSGPVPHLPNISTASYTNNSGPCGGPLPACVTTKINRRAVIAGAAIGGATLGSAVAFILCRSLTMRSRRSPRETNQ